MLLSILCVKTSKGSRAVGFSGLIPRVQNYILSSIDMEVQSHSLHLLSAIAADSEELCKIVISEDLIQFCVKTIFDVCSVNSQLSKKYGSSKKNIETSSLSTVQAAEISAYYQSQILLKKNNLVDVSIEYLLMTFTVYKSMHKLDKMKTTYQPLICALGYLIKLSGKHFYHDSVALLGCISMLNCTSLKNKIADEDILGEVIDIMLYHQSSFASNFFLSLLNSFAVLEPSNSLKDLYSDKCFLLLHNYLHSSNKKVSSYAIEVLSNLAATKNAKCSKLLLDYKSALFIRCVCAGVVCLEDDAASCADCISFTRGSNSSTAGTASSFSIAASSPDLYSSLSHHFLSFTEYYLGCESAAFFLFNNACDTAINVSTLIQCKAHVALCNILRYLHAEPCHKALLTLRHFFRFAARIEEDERSDIEQLRMVLRCNSAGRSIATESEDGRKRENTRDCSEEMSADEDDELKEKKQERDAKKCFAGATRMEDEGKTSAMQQDVEYVSCFSSSQIQSIHPSSNVNTLALSNPSIPSSSLLSPFVPASVSSSSPSSQFPSRDSYHGAVQAKTEKEEENDSESCSESDTSCSSSNASCCHDCNNEYDDEEEDDDRESAKKCMIESVNFGLREKSGENESVLDLLQTTMQKLLSDLEINGRWREIEKFQSSKHDTIKNIANEIMTKYLSSIFENDENEENEEKEEGEDLDGDLIVDDISNKIRCGTASA
ncbi:uncharacterized protein MONOS_3931 [Monocercomonoides exilis]|uniref:uncharacterized protein n=1 Tax=Monocercomonoides exilis TaxID=2049356 RepID=UPI00355A9DD2|nr:hypothetical protein MONOS_3931 [Monocercomonoides exilis]|eukprot:MONOS_3931.1-p1 / transcript=MONOS_3931.1 / gene=MONOS_3931 / organism=Monocercomonoides_exilis_PA203 / gene_product=unspecified product / transcript_product=unspecified product / location=Mono_scaffold00098:18656-21465(+) / protein_length=718 / sequence_SO=supercontig / SO=protein_coding / is_pseudo=false